MLLLREQDLDVLGARPSSKDKEILRELAKQVAEIAALPVQQETAALWKALNGLRPVRPMVVIDQVPWHEMDVDGSLVLQSKSEFCRGFEAALRRTLYSWDHMRADMVVDPVILVPKVIRSDGFGIRTNEVTAATDVKSDVFAHFYADQLKTEEDVQRIRAPEISFDADATAIVEEWATEIFDGILPVRMQGWLPNATQWHALEQRQDSRHLVSGMCAWDIVVTWRGAENVLFDLADRPEFMHQIISRLTDAHLVMLDRIEQMGLLGYGQASVAFTGARTDELPAPDFDPKHPRAKDVWTACMSQILTSVSPAMFKEFELPYVSKWAERFGLVYYGCCDVLDNKVDILRSIPHLRKISMSPWVNMENGAEQIGKDFVFSRKPNPALLALDKWDPETVERDLRDTIDVCARHGCPLELILKDISTVRYQPRRLWEWADIAMRLVQG